jgi:uncharacterized membrane protein YebE (DUF533 family)
MGPLLGLGKVATDLGGVALGTIAGLALSKKMKEEQEKEKERQAIARKKEAAKPRDRRGKRGTQSGVTAVKRDGAVIRGKTRAKYGGTL